MLKQGDALHLFILHRRAIEVIENERYKDESRTNEETSSELESEHKSRQCS